ncbi:hypothetical protein GCM10010286_23100 [Streptomyces toxytricini]|nr:hypothetical protein GCM10010286_23100 [Streptomyces toxytricini]
MSATAPLVHYRLHPLSMTDRRNRGVSQLCRAEVCTALAQRLRALASAPPPWTARRDLNRMSRHFHALAAGHRVEAQVQLGRRRACLRSLAAMLINTARSGDEGAAGGMGSSGRTSARGLPRGRVCPSPNSSTRS